MHPGIPWRDADSRAFQGFTKSYRAISSRQSVRRRAGDRFVDRADEGFAGEAIHLVALGVDQRQQPRAYPIGRV
jgi:hypothetical protein